MVINTIICVELNLIKLMLSKENSLNRYRCVSDEALTCYNRKLYKSIGHIDNIYHLSAQLKKKKEKRSNSLVVSPPQADVWFPGQ